ncbi:helix-turn-helix transcriptional regulator [Propionibacteriaceae bacterium Y1700]|uniref:helix-turn-helix transcriptional regulator n=1 Tax=Microlunatus sp. Y1700 TaxID=3418487 RepID=UPI003DA76E4B
MKSVDRGVRDRALDPRDSGDQARFGGVNPADSDSQDASTRRRVEESIMQCGPSTAAELAERLELTAAAIRRHLSALADCGRVEARDQRVYGARGRGRPAKVFALTDVGRAGFRQAYDDLAIRAIEFLARSQGSEAVRDFATQRLGPVEQRYRDILAEADDEVAPTDALASALTEDGYVASTRPAAAGMQICQHHCPVAHVAEEFPELCEMETEAFSRLLGVHVQRLATIAHGDGVCTTHIPNPHVPKQSVPDQRPADAQASAQRPTTTKNAVNRKADQ